MKPSRWSLSLALLMLTVGRSLAVEPQPCRVRVGQRVYTYTELLALTPADTRDQPVEVVADFRFSHPGTLLGRAELDLLKQRVAAGEEPWAGRWQRLLRSRFARRDYLTKLATPPTVISCDFSGANDHGSLQEMRDATAAYTQALAWSVTGERVFADNAAGILETYARTVTSHEGKNWYLEAAWAGAVFPAAADLLKSTCPDWRQAPLVAKWFNDVLLPPLHNRLAFGNRESACLNALAAIAVFNEDRAALYEALQHYQRFVPSYCYLASDGPAPALPDYGSPERTPTDAFLRALGAASYPREWTHWLELSQLNWSEAKRRGRFGDDKTWLTKTLQAQDPGLVWVGAPQTYLDGWCAETARDLSHAEIGFAATINVAELAWHQGLDLYAPHAERLCRFMETAAGLRLGTPPPATVAKPLVAYGATRTFEIAYHHFHARRGRELPQTRRLLERLRAAGPDVTYPSGGRGDEGRDPANPRLWRYAEPLGTLFASSIGAGAGWINNWEALTHGE